MEDWEILKIKGIPLKIHPSWFGILFIFTWISQNQFSKLIEAPNPSWISWLAGLSISLLLFVSVLFHELGHSFVARAEGVKVQSITLFFMGGVAKVDKECATPLGTFRVAVAGPLVSLILSFLFFTAANLSGSEKNLTFQVFAQLGSLNLILALFNLLPSLPLDGGIILKSLVWYFTGSQHRGLKVAITFSKSLSFLALFFGTLFIIINGNIGGIYLILLGWFGLISSKSQNQMLVINEILTSLKISQIPRKKYRVLDGDLPLREISKIRRSTKNNLIDDWILVTSEGRWNGYINYEVLKEIPVQHWDQYKIIEYSMSLNDLPSISDKKPLWFAVLEIEKTKGGKLLSLNDAGLPSGIIDRSIIGKAVLVKLGLNLPDNFLEVSKKENKYPLGLGLPKLVNDMISTGLIKLDSN